MSKIINSWTELLKEPFAVDEIEWRIGATLKDKLKGLAVAYITNRAIQNRLDKVCGVDGWQNEFKEVNGGFVCGISISIHGSWITKYDGASLTGIEPIKGGLSDAMKRAAAQWGIGRYLYKIPAQWVKIKLQGKSYVIDEVPKLPAWALPEPKNIEPCNWKPEENQEDELSESVIKCFKAFEKFNVSKEEIESFLCLEAVMITDNDLETLGNIWRQLNKGTKTKEDFFVTHLPKVRSKQVTDLENKLKNVD